MKPFKQLADLISGKRTIVTENVGGRGSYLLDKVSLLKCRYAKTFFHQSIICCISDAFEYFLEIDGTNNIFYQNILAMTEQASERFIKWETLYHTLMYTKNLADNKEVSELEMSLFYLFGMSDEERAEYYGFKGLLTEDESVFAETFSNTAAIDIFDIVEISNMDTSFIYNFYHSCYTEFHRVYTKYSVRNYNPKDSDNICLDILQVSK